MSKFPGRTDLSPGIYVHVPFCRTKCPYCDFYSITGPAGEDRYLRSLQAEISIRAGATAGPAGSLYVGGGTPSVMDPRLLSRIPSLLALSPGLETDAEVTVEVNPDDVTPEALRLYLDGGFNRISIGVQSFDDGELEFLGRRHDSGRAEEAVKAARAAGFPSIGIDLIFGLAGQTPAGWRRTLDKAAGYGPEHISCYQLTLEPGTPMGEREAAGEAVCADEETQRKLFLETSMRLAEAGYMHYEVSNFARGEENRSRHNSRYWDRIPYLGLGPAAHSFDGSVRSWNHRSVSLWLESLEKGVCPVAGEEMLTAGQERAERLMLGFRTLNGVEKALLEERDGWDEILEELVEIRLVTVDGDRVIPTVEGFLMADQLPQLFI
jgi:oxygen-independent coproporphyrinogen-3 oxidase